MLLLGCLGSHWPLPGAGAGFELHPPCALPLGQGFHETEENIFKHLLCGLLNNDANSGHLVWGILIDRDLILKQVLSQQQKWLSERWWHHLHQVVRVLTSTVSKILLDVGITQDPTEAHRL